GGQHVALGARPARVEVLARQQVRQLGDRPVRLDRGGGQAPDLLRVQQGGDQHPRGRLLRQRRCREQLEATLSRRLEVALLGAVAELGRKAGDQGAVQGLVGGGAFAGPKTGVRVGFPRFPAVLLVLLKNRL